MDSLRPIRAAWLFSLAAFCCLLLAPALRAQPGSGYIEVRAEPGLRVFLDDVLKGTTKAELGGLVLDAVPAGDRVVRIEKDGFTPQQRTVRVVAGEVFLYQVAPFRPAVTVKQGGAQTTEQVVQKTGSLLLQTIPVSCEIAIATVQLPEEARRKTIDKWEAGDMPSGTHKITLRALGKQVVVDAEIRPQEKTHLFVNLLTGVVENKSSWVASGASTAAAEVPSAPQPRIDLPPAENPRDRLARAQRDAAAVEAEIAKVDAALQNGGDDLDRISALSERRNGLASALGAAKEAVRAAQAAVADERRQNFLADYAKFEAVRANAAVPDTTKLAAWRALCARWSLSVGDSPVPLAWGKNGPDVLRGTVRIALTGPWPEGFAAPEVSIDGVPGRWADGPPARYSGQENQGIAAGQRRVRITHAQLEDFEAVVDVPAGAVAELSWRPVLRAGVARPANWPMTIELAAGVGVDLLQIAPGTFAMGTARGGDSDEQPVTLVTISRPFWLSKTEVTQAQWQAVMGNNPSQFKGDDHPVEKVSWDDAMTFCRKLTELERAAGRLPEGYTYTLPTEAQWEYACRAGTTGDYAGNLDAMAWYSANSGNQTHPVGQKQANAWGLHDMHGNVWEWCLDWKGNYPGGSVTDLAGAPSGSHRVSRGGSWGDGAVGCRSAVRNGAGPGLRVYFLGFRLALSSVR